MTKINMKITYLKRHWNLPEANELNIFNVWQCYVFIYQTPTT